MIINFKLKKKQFEDDFNSRKTTLERELANLKEETEKDLAAREKAVIESENELNALREKVSSYPAELQSAIDNAVKAATEKIIMEAQHKESIISAKYEGEKQVLLTKIESYDSIIKNQSQTIEKLNVQIEKSYGQVQNIALKAVEGSSPSPSAVSMRNASQNAKNEE